MAAHKIGHCGRQLLRVLAAKALERLAVQCRDTGQLAGVLLSQLVCCGSCSSSDFSLTSRLLCSDSCSVARLKLR